jgi:hypothetical protein
LPNSLKRNKKRNRFNRDHNRKDLPSPIATEYNDEREERSFLLALRYLTFSSCLRQKLLCYYGVPKHEIFNGGTVSHHRPAIDLDVIVVRKFRREARSTCSGSSVISDSLMCIQLCVLDVSSHFLVARFLLCRMHGSPLQLILYKRTRSV